MVEFRGLTFTLSHLPSSETFLLDLGVLSLSTFQFFGSFSAFAGPTTDDGNSDTASNGLPNFDLLGSGGPHESPSSQHHTRY